VKYILNIFMYAVHNDLLYKNYFGLLCNKGAWKAEVSGLFKCLNIHHYILISVNNWELMHLLLLWLHGPFSLTLASLLIAVHSTPLLCFYSPSSCTKGFYIIFNVIQPCWCILPWPIKIFFPSRLGPVTCSEVKLFGPSTFSVGNQGIIFHQVFK
jgi:hypothetical protein